MAPDLFAYVKKLVALGFLGAMVSACGGGGSGGGGGGGGNSGGPRPGACTTAVTIAASDSSNGTLTSDDCTLQLLFPGTVDASFVDQYRITLPSHGRLEIDLRSTAFDAFLVLLNDSLELPEIAADDDSGGNLDARIEVDLSPGTYVILANSATTTADTGAYTLATEFVPAIWIPTSTTGAPEARTEHTAVWTGTEMIVWGGHNGNAIAMNTGARFDPVSNTWTPISTAGAPAARLLHTALWTGTEMIVWGGFSGAFDFQALNDGARYDPQTDSWTPISAINVPSARMSHTAVWTGTEMIVWGGFFFSSQTVSGGAMYDPAADTWAQISTLNAPPDSGNHVAVWTGSAMVVWGGENDGSLIASGGIYNPVSDSWLATSQLGVPSARAGAAAVWTGSELIVYGGRNSISAGIDGTGGRFDPSANIWTSTNVVGAPIFTLSTQTRAVWSGTRLIVWGEGGARYDPASDSWSGVSTSAAPSLRRHHSLTWSGSAMIVWGGDFTSPVSNGGIYNPDVDPTP